MKAVQDMTARQLEAALAKANKVRDLACDALIAAGGPEMNQQEKAAEWAARYANDQRHHERVTTIKNGEYYKLRSDRLAKENEALKATLEAERLEKAMLRARLTALEGL